MSPTAGNVCMSRCVLLIRRARLTPIAFHWWRYCATLGLVSRVGGYKLDRVVPKTFADGLMPWAQSLATEVALRYVGGFQHHIHNAMAIPTFWHTAGRSSNG